MLTEFDRWIRRVNSDVKTNKCSNRIFFSGREYTVSKSVQKDCTTYSFSGENGDSQMTVYTIADGIKVIVHSVHADMSFMGTPKKGNVIEIHHCREGRMERPAGDKCFYLMPGDLAIEIVNRETAEYLFPLRHYHGITVSINTDIAPKCFSCFLKDVSVRPAKVAERLCGKDRCFVMRSKEYIEHIFSEMYTVPCANKKAYYKIKLLELLLVISGLEPDDNKLSAYALSNAQVELAKRVADYISNDAENRFTVSELAQHFYVSETHLRNAFKGVFGVPVFSYIRTHRMNIAARELVKTNKTVAEIAGMCGYDNSSKFSCAFKEIMNKTPLEYRKIHRRIDVHK